MEKEEKMITVDVPRIDFSGHTEWREFKGRRPRDWHRRRKRQTVK